MAGNGGLWLMMIAGVGVLVAAARSTVGHVRARKGTKVLGRVLGCSREPAGRGRSAWRGAVRFHDPEGGDWREAQVYLARPCPPGSEVVLCYPPDRPDRVRVFAGMVNWKTPVLGSLVGTVFILVPLLIMTGVIPTSPVPPR
ncbi:hypothetical protein ATKI12_6449 [Kitasatospora sp. Ki12]|uniref:DUF3592 domain-containing protein n=1 Tax=Kitasatospora xanthocidica TaxID=83382 RepID=UPI0016721006|nr:DUF3592 domain-containing protein [Kitasatospora xanthocidica]GHF92063.1 hypothetical protein GCM10018790_81420 [Kitasatospora xanthocidica]